MVRLNLTWIFFCFFGLGACTEGQPSSQPAAGQPKPVAFHTPAEKPDPPAAADNLPGDQEEMLGLDLQPVNGWKPVWDPRAKSARWEHSEYMSPIVVRLVTEKLDDIEDLKQAAPWMMQLGSAITGVDEVQQNGRGWYAVVRRGKEKDFVYVINHDSIRVVCSARLTRSEIKTIKKNTALQACDSIRLRSRSDRARSEVQTDPGSR